MTTGQFPRRLFSETQMSALSERRAEALEKFNNHEPSKYGMAVMEGVIQGVIPAVILGSIPLNRAGFRGLLRLRHEPETKARTIKRRPLKETRHSVRGMK